MNICMNTNTDTKKKRTELVFILDKSGSMHGLEKDTIGGYNAMLEKQRLMEDECVITTVLFCDQYELLHDRIDARAISPITEEEYSVGGATALLDAIGRTLHKIESAQAHTAEEFRADKVMVVIITDGYENASREYSGAAVRQMIGRLKEQGWEFVFLGANIDAVETASQFGIDATRAVDYVPDSQGTELNFATVCDVVSSFRACGVMEASRLDDIRRDMKRRGRRR